MALTAHQRFVGYPAIFGALTIPDVQNVSPSSGVQKLTAMASGSVDPSIVAEIYRESNCSLTAVNLGAILAAVDLVNGLYVEATSQIQYRARAVGGTFQGGANHISLTSSLSFLHVEGISARQGDTNAVGLTLKHIPLYDGVNAPYVVNLNQPLVGTPSIGAVYKLGPVVLEGTKLRGVQSSQFQTGITFQTKGGDGALAPSVGSITKRQGTMNVDCDNIELTWNIGLGSTPIQNGITMYLQKVGVAPNVAQHVALTITGGLYEVTEVPAGGEQDANCRLVVTGAVDQAIAYTVALGVTLP